MPCWSFLITNKILLHALTSIFTNSTELSGCPSCELTMLVRCGRTCGQIRALAPPSSNTARSLANRLRNGTIDCSPSLVAIPCAVPAWQRFFSFFVFPLSETADLIADLASLSDAVPMVLVP